MDERVSQLVPEPFHARGNMFSLHGRVALVTGSSQGLGFEIARGFADAGATGIIQGRSAEKAEQACKALVDVGPTFWRPLKCRDWQRS